jgi:outer membrane protein OmpA-like peptidoglycan-associated protein
MKRKDIMKFSRLTGSLLTIASLLVLAGSAQAQEVTLKLEPGVAVPLTRPQDYHFDAGVAGQAKLLVSLNQYLAIGPSVSELVLGNGNHTTAVGSAFGVGGGLVLHRPHDHVNNTGSGFSAVSPWLDGDLQYIRTGTLDRAGLSLAVGASVPTSDARNLWIGPFVRYQDIVQEKHPGIDGTDAHVLIAGLSFEIGPTQRRVAPPVETQEVPVVPAPAPQVQPPPPPPPVVVVAAPAEIRQKVQFLWDSSVIQVTENTKLTEVVKTLLANPNYKAVVEGHASSEGQVAHNDALSLRRAQAVVKYLVGKGVSQDRLSAVGFGSRVPVATNSTLAGRVANRRVEFNVTVTITKAQ